MAFNSTLIPSTAGQIMPGWGIGTRRVKYLQCLDLKESGSSHQYFALFKVFEETASNSDGLTDNETDLYIGMRVRDKPGVPPQEITTVNLNSAHIKLLDRNNAGNRREILAEVQIRQTGQSGASGDAKKWFHLYGTFL